MAAIGADYYLVIYTPAWAALGIIWRFRSLRVTQVVNAQGELRVAFGAHDLPFSRASLVRDCRIDVFRALPGADAVRVEDAIWLLRSVTYRKATNEIEIIAHSAIDLLRTREVLGAAGSAAADKAGAADSLIVSYVEESAVSPSDPLRTISTLTALPALGTGPTVTMQASQRDLLKICQDICGAAGQAGTPVYVDVRYSDTAAGLQLRTYVGVRGTDRGTNSASRLTFAEERDNLIDLTVTDDWRGETTVAYVLGAGQGDSQTVAAVVSGRAASTSYSRVEATVYGGQAKDTAALEAAGEAHLYANRPRRTIGGTAQQTPVCLYGVHWGLGDLVVIDDGDGGSYDARIDTVEIAVENGDERIRASFRVEVSL